MIPRAGSPALHISESGGQFANLKFDRDDYSAEDDLCKGVRRMSTTPQKAPEPRAPFRHYSYRDADERPPAWQRKSAF